MITKPFSYDDCHPHRDGKRRALMHNGSVCDLLSNQASGDRSIVVEFEGNLSRRFSNGCLFEHQISYRDLVGPAPEQPRISDSVIDDAIDAGLKAIDIIEVAKEDLLHRKQLRVWLRAALECVVQP